MDRQKKLLEAFRELFLNSLDEEENIFIKSFDSESLIKYFWDYFKNDFIYSAGISHGKEYLQYDAAHIILERIHESLLNDFKFNYYAQFGKNRTLEDRIKSFNQYLFDVEIIEPILDNIDPKEDEPGIPFEHREIEDTVWRAGENIIHILDFMGKLKIKHREINPVYLLIAEYIIANNCSLKEACEQPKFHYDYQATWKYIVRNEKHFPILKECHDIIKTFSTRNPNKTKKSYRH